MTKDRFDYFRCALARIIEKAEDTDNPLVKDLISLYDELDAEGGTILDE